MGSLRENQKGATLKWPHVMLFMNYSKASQFPRRSTRCLWIELITHFKWLCYSLPWCETGEDIHRTHIHENTDHHASEHEQQIKLLHTFQCKGDVSAIISTLAIHPSPCARTALNKQVTLWMRAFIVPCLVPQILTSHRIKCPFSGMNRVT